MPWWRRARRSRYGSSTTSCGATATCRCRCSAGSCSATDPTSTRSTPRGRGSTRSAERARIAVVRPHRLRSDGGACHDRGVADRLMLLDTASLYFRAFYGVPDTITAPNGTPVNAVRGLLDMIARLVTEFEPTHLVACWDDDWRPQWRVDL